MKAFTSQLRTVYWQKSHNYLMCEFPAHYARRNAEVNLKSTTTDGFIFPIIISLRKSWKGGGGGGGGWVRLTWLDLCTLYSKRDTSESVKVT